MHCICIVCLCPQSFVSSCSHNWFAKHGCPRDFGGTRKKLTGIMANVEQLRGLEAFCKQTPCLDAKNCPTKVFHGVATGRRLIRAKGRSSDQTVGLKTSCKNTNLAFTGQLRNL